MGRISKREENLSGNMLGAPPTAQPKASKVRTLTLASDDLDAHAGMSVPLDGVELDVAREHGVVEVVVLHRV